MQKGDLCPRAVPHNVKCSTGEKQQLNELPSSREKKQFLKSFEED